MEQEAFFSGYCRCVDANRMVCAVKQDGELCEADCAYPQCPHKSECAVARAIDCFLNQI